MYKSHCVPPLTLCKKTLQGDLSSDNMKFPGISRFFAALAPMLRYLQHCQCYKQTTNVRVYSAKMLII